MMARSNLSHWDSGIAEQAERMVDCTSFGWSVFDRRPKRLIAGRQQEERQQDGSFSSHRNAKLRDDGSVPLVREDIGFNERARPRHGWFVVAQAAYPPSTYEGDLAVASSPASGGPPGNRNVLIA
jgi:hypothetical protein